MDASSRRRSGALSFGLGDLALLLQTTLWAINYPAAKAVLGAFEPLTLSSLRTSVTALCFLTAAALAPGALRVERRDLPRFLLLALLGHALFQAMLTIGLSLTTAGNSALLMALAPVIVALLVTLGGGERLSVSAWLGVAASFAGVVVLVAATGREVRFGGATLAGDLISLVGAAAWAVYTVLSRPVLARYSAVTVNACTLPAGAAMALLIASPQLATQSWAAITPPYWLGFAYVTAASALSYFLYNVGVQRLGASRSSAYFNLTPPLAALASWVLLGEPLTPLYLVAAALILGGLSLVRTGVRAAR